MNFLAHLHLAWINKSSLAGNLVADYIRGDPFSQFSEELASGVMFHRKIDKYVDSLVDIKSAKVFFRKNLVRFSLISLDILWDHFLAKNWDKIEQRMNLSVFCKFAKNKISEEIIHFSLNIQEFNEILWSENWLENYKEFSYLETVLMRMAKRRPKLADLAKTFIDLEKNYFEFELIFQQFYPALMKKAEINSF